MTDKTVKIANRLIGANNPVFIIAELSANHNQDYNNAVKSLKAIKKAGADAVKLQTYTPDTITLNCRNKYFKINKGTLWDGKYLYDLYKEAYTPWEWQPKLQKLAKKLGLILFSTPFDKSAVDYLEKMKVPAYKVASFEITDVPLIEYIASKGKPIIISTGIAEYNDIKEAVNTCRRMNNNNIILLKCTSAYPAKYEDMDLRTIPDMSKRFKVISGLSDHTMGISSAIAAVALGAKVIEKHFILNRNIGGPDAYFSLETKEFSNMVCAVRNAEKSLGKINYNLTSQAKKNREFSRSLFIVKDIAKGECFSNKNVRSIRPGNGLHPRNLNKVIGKKTKKSLRKGYPLRIDYVK